MRNDIHEPDPKMITRIGMKIKFELTIGFVLLLLVVLAGCGGFIGAQSPEPTSTAPTPQSPAETVTTTESPTPTPTSTKTETPELSVRYKQRFFTSNYTTSIEENGVNVTNTTIDGQNETLYLTYEMREPDSDVYTGRERENISLFYAAMAEIYYDRGYDESWIPKQVNVTAFAPNGQIYEKAHMNYEKARKVRTGEISAYDFLLEYYGTIELGPANPEYEG